MLLLELQRFIIPAAVLIISFLSFSSQLLFYHISPGPLGPREAAVFNVLIACVFICYARACLTDPGKISSQGIKNGDGSNGRWCTKCDAPKPPRSHHCRVCASCIAKMDHHCPWTANCVGHRAFPHFLRFLSYSVVAMSFLAYFLYLRVAHIWSHRAMPSVHGPNIIQLTHLFSLCLVNSISLFALFTLLMSSLWTLGANVYAIEGLEIERHEVLLRRARRNGGYLYATDGAKIRLVRHEFPYDIGIFANICQGMGSVNPLSWFWPLSASPALESGLHFETNGFEDAGASWPPPDPDRMASYRTVDSYAKPTNFEHLSSIPEMDGNLEIRRRQHEDYARRGMLQAKFSDSLWSGTDARGIESGSVQHLGVNEQVGFDDYGYSSDD